MENATKALLIAAAVLIAIVLIALGVLLLGNVSDTSEQADKVGNAIDIATGNAASDVIGGTKQIIISKKDFNSFIDNIAAKYPKMSDIFKKINNEQNNILSNQISIEGYLYSGGKINNLYDVVSEFNIMKQSLSKEEFGKYVVGDWIYKSEISDKLEKLSEPSSQETVNSIGERLKNIYNTSHPGHSLTDTQVMSRAKAVRYFGYDEWGYVNKMVYIAYINLD